MKISPLHCNYLLFCYFLCHHLVFSSICPALCPCTPSDVCFRDVTRGELATLLLVHYKDDQERLAKIMDKLLDKEVRSRQTGWTGQDEIFSECLVDRPLDNKILHVVLA